MANFGLLHYAVVFLVVAVIAAAVGYDNPFVFSRTFKKWIGWPPSDYRHRQR